MMKKLVEDLYDVEVAYNGEDSHAKYFIDVMGNEYKVIRESGEAEMKEVGSEDWY